MNYKILVLLGLVCTPILIVILSTIPALKISDTTVTYIIILCIILFVFFVIYMFINGRKWRSVKMPTHTQEEVIYACAKYLLEMHFIKISYNLQEGVKSAKYNAKNIECIPTFPQNDKEWFAVKIEAYTRKSKSEPTRILLFIDESLRIRANLFTYASLGSKYYKNLLWENPELFFTRGVSKTGKENTLLSMIRSQIADEDGNVDVDDLVKLSQLKGLKNED